jgi:hypothetical protein
MKKAAKRMNGAESRRDEAKSWSLRRVDVGESVRPRPMAMFTMADMTM